MYPYHQHTVFAALAGLAVLAGAGSHAQEDIAHDFAWLTGCWEDGAGSREIWSAHEGPMMFGYAVTLSDGEVQFFEQLRIETDDDGARFAAYPNGEGPTVFEMMAQDATSAAFLNPDHDYPQRITYARKGGQLIASIALADGSRQRDFIKTRCSD